MAKNKTQQITQGFFEEIPTKPQNIQDPTMTFDNELVMKLVNEVFSTENVAIRTEYSGRMVKAISKAKIYARLFNIQSLDKFIDILSINLISKDRKSRKEFKEIAKTVGGNSFAGVEDTPSLSKKFMGW